MYEAYKTRVGDAEFSRNISQLFEEDRYLYELRIGSEHVLISEKHPEGAQILIEKQGKVLVGGRARAYFALNLRT